MEVDAALMVWAGSAQQTLVKQPLPLIFPGPLLVYTGGIHIPTDGAYQILNVRATVGTPAVGQAIICDLLVNNVSVFTTQANRPTIAAGVNASSVVVPDVVLLNENDQFSLNIVQVGNQVPGADLTMLVSLQRLS